MQVKNGDGFAGAKTCVEGAAAGIVGTLALWGVREAMDKYLPTALKEPMRLEPGEFVARRAHNVLPASTWGKIPHAAEASVAQSLGFVYGLTFGAVYAWLRPKSNSILTDGILLGLACWAVGYLGWLPATGLMPPIAKQKPGQIATPIATHALFGLFTAKAYQWLRERF